MKAGTKSQSKRATEAPELPQDHGFGRPRDERIDDEVVAAVLDTLRLGGYGAVTIDGIARAVKRARTSIYRRWPSKRHLVAYAVVSEMGDNPRLIRDCCARTCKPQSKPYSRRLPDPWGRRCRFAVGTLAQDEALAETIRHQVLAARRKSMREAFGRARAREDPRRSQY